MKKMVLITVFILISALLFAEAENGDSKFSLDVGAELSVGYFTTVGESDFAAATQLILIMLSLRGGFLVDFTYAINEQIKVGGEAGVMYMTISSDVGTTSWTLLDIPLRVIGRFQLGPLFVQPHVGAWLGVSGIDDFLGFNFDVGTKLGLGGKFKFYLTGSYIIGTVSYPRFGLGVAYNLLNF